ncbi:MAG: hypothetical protein VB016_03245 [Methanomassiliicoccaceae archaeon]|nr:hypothetical protein [Methanomassiliicoccaceae archaeon]
MQYTDVKAFSVIMHAIYALAVVGAILFVAFGFIPESTEESPLDFKLEVESTYDVSEPVGVLEYNFSDAVNSYGNRADAYTEEGDMIPGTTIYPDDDASVTAAVASVKAYALSNPDTATVTLKDQGGTVLTQSMIMKESDEITTNMYTEISITNRLRYDLIDIEVGVDQLNDTGTVSYRIVDSVPTTIKTGETQVIPVNISINSLNSALIMLTGSGDTMDIYMGFDISGRYLYGLAGASIYAKAAFTSSTAAPDVDISATQISVTSTEPIDQLPSDLDVTAFIGAVKVTIVNGPGGFSMEMGDGTVDIVDELQAQYDQGDYTIEVGVGPDTEIIELTQEQYAEMIDLIKQVMESGGA